jgi:plastocyanin
VNFSRAILPLTAARLCALSTTMAIFLHHAYLTSPTFEFDSNDQKPGSSFTVVFPVAGNFTVRCGIHPKMKLMVKVN